MSPKTIVPKILGGVAIVVFVLAWLGGCAWFISGMWEEAEKDWGPDQSEYVGVWACYLSKTDGGEFRPESIDDVVSFVRLQEGGEGQIVVAMFDEPYIIDCRWTTTHRDRRDGTNTGILLMGKEDGFSNPYQYFTNTEDEAHLIDGRLNDGDLVIDYGYRKEYLEKISNDPNYQPWLISDNQSEVTNQTSNASSNSMPQGAIDWTEASKHIGETVTVYGKVVDAEYASSSSSRPTFLDLGAAYPRTDRVSIVIWGKNRSAFSSSPESMYDGKTICVTGEVYIYDGVCNIEVSSPSQITVL